MKKFARFIFCVLLCLIFLAVCMFGGQYVYISGTVCILALAMFMLAMMVLSALYETCVTLGALLARSWASLRG